MCELLKHDYIQAKADAKTRQSETTNTLDAVAGKMVWNKSTFLLGDSWIKGVSAWVREKSTPTTQKKVDWGSLLLLPESKKCSFHIESLVPPPPPTHTHTENGGELCYDFGKRAHLTDFPGSSESVGTLWWVFVDKKWIGIGIKPKKGNL